LEPIANRHGFGVRFATSEASPGHLPHHYQPSVPLILVKSKLDEQEIYERVQQLLNKPGCMLHFLQLGPTPVESARLLYAEMRTLSQNPANVIVAEPTRWNWSGDSV